MATALEELVQRIQGMDPASRAELEKEVRAATGKWVPIPPENGVKSPQQRAIECLADVLLYGGEGGGGKTDLICGLAQTDHYNSLLMRRHFADTGGLTARSIQINGTNVGFSGSSPAKLRTADGRRIDFAGAKNAGDGITPGDEEHWQGRPHDFLGLDEVVQFAESQVRFLMGWLRSADGRRCRTILASNPPLGVQGVWIISMFAPWLDPTFSNPAQDGELRWVVTIIDPHTGRWRDEWVDGPDAKVSDGKGGYLVPKSRSFIRARLADNPYLRDTNYKAELDALPEPMRSAIRDGNFMAARIDEDDQLIPTNWVLQSQARWRDTPPLGVPQCAIGVDGASVNDQSVLAPRHDGWYSRLITKPGIETPHGTDLAAFVITHRRDASIVNIDVLETTGAQAYAHLTDNGIECYAYKGGDTTVERTQEKQYSFYNVRSAAYWKFMEALDPGQDGGSPIDLPEDPELTADLTAVTWELTPRGIKILSKKKVVEKLGRSPDKGDAVVMSWYRGARAQTHMPIWQPDERVGSRTARSKKHGVNLGPRHRQQRRR